MCFNNKKIIKVAIVSASDSIGGAARATFRLYQAVTKNQNKILDCKIYVKDKNIPSNEIYTIENRYSRVFNTINGYISRKILALFPKKNKSFHSFNLLGSSVFKLVNNSDADLINIHWINNNTLSIRQISKFNKPVIFTLHDMWAFCGCEHISYDNNYKNGYPLEISIKGLDINYISWRIKKHYWKKKKYHIICPSNWLASCAKKSLIFQNCVFHVIPNSLDTSIFKDKNKLECRKRLGLPSNKILIGFGAMGGGQDPNKGLDLLIDAINYKKIENAVLVLFGTESEKLLNNAKIESICLGHINSDSILTDFYNSMNIMVVPSRVESLCQVAMESISCGTPVCAFECTGLPDVVEHKYTGYLAKPFEPSSLSKGIEWCIDNANNINYNCRNKAITTWDNNIVSHTYQNLIKEIYDEYYVINNNSNI